MTEDQVIDLPLSGHQLIHLAKYLVIYCLNSFSKNQIQVCPNQARNWLPLRRTLLNCSLHLHVQPLRSFSHLNLWMIRLNQMTRHPLPPRVQSRFKSIRLRQSHQFSAPNRRSRRKWKRCSIPLSPGSRKEGGPQVLFLSNWHLHYRKRLPNNLPPS